MAAKASHFNMELFFQALGDNTRLRLLNLMGDQEICVCYFVEILGQSQPKISRHLAYLRRAGIVEARRENRAFLEGVVMDGGGIGKTYRHAGILRHCGAPRHPCRNWRAASLSPTRSAACDTL